MAGCSREPPNRRISVDLKSIIVTGGSGRYLLRLLDSNGVDFLSEGLPFGTFSKKLWSSRDAVPGASRQERTFTGSSSSSWVIKNRDSMRTVFEGIALEDVAILLAASWTWLGKAKVIGLRESIHNLAKMSGWKSMPIKSHLVTREMQHV